MVLPVWNPQNPSVGDKVARAIVYFVALVYMFLGMSIIADRFMSSIEVGDTSLLFTSECLYCFCTILLCFGLYGDLVHHKR